MHTDYLNMSVEELAADQAVCDLTLHGKEAAAWENWIEQNPEVAVRMLQAQRLIRELHAAVGQESIAKERIDKTWSRIAADTKAEAKVIGMRGWIQRKEWGKVAGLAAAAAAILVFMLLYNPAGDVYATRRGQQLAVYLADSTKVTLGPESSLRVLSYEAGNRQVELRGEAFFEVRKGDPFNVQTPQGNVGVLGTSFTVRTRESAFHVACATGRVRVDRKGAEQILTPGEAVTGTATGLSPLQKVVVEDIDGFTRNLLQYTDITLAELGEEIERYYDRQVEINDSNASRRIDIRIPSNDFPTVVTRLSTILQLQVDTTAGKLQIGR